MNALESIRHLNPCNEGVEWLRAGNYPNLQSAWDACPWADWLFWLVRRGRITIDRITIGRMTTAIARDVLPAFEMLYPHDNRPRLAIEAAEAWCDDPTPEHAADADAAAHAAMAARDDARNNARISTALTANAAWATAWVAEVAAAAAWAAIATDDGIDAVVWVINAANAAVVADLQRHCATQLHYAVEQCHATRCRHADIVRSFFPSPPEIP